MHYVVRLADLVPNTSRGVSVTPLVGRPQGAVHLHSEIWSIDPGVRLPPHVHPHEEAALVLDGSVELERDDGRWILERGDHVIAGVGESHVIQTSSSNARLLVVTSPQPRGKPSDSINVRPWSRSVDRQQREIGTVLARGLGHFGDEQLSPPGDQQQAGYHGGGVTGVSIRMLVDAQQGANHMNVFVVQFEPGGAGHEHDHPYEESYLLLEGEAEAVLEGARYELAAGDFVWTSVGASHAFYNRSARPVRWIETQTPQPPRQNGHRFIAEWEELWKNAEIGR